MAGAGILETTLAANFVPGTNLRGRVAGANWSFLLPSLELDVVVCAGAPGAAALRTLARVGKRVVVCDTSERLRALARELGRDNHRARNLLFVAADPARLPLADGRAALLALDSRRSPAATPGEVERLRAPGAVVYSEAPDSGSQALDARDALEFQLAPGSGEARVAAPLGAPGLLGWLARSGLAPRPAGGAFVRRFAEPLRRLLRLRGRRALLRGEGVGTIPRYIAEIAGAANVDLSGWRCALSAQGLYASRKLLLVLFPPESDEPGGLVKLVRDADWNARLENESRALVQLAALDALHAGLAPRVLFAGHHGGLALVGQTLVAGEPLRRLVLAAPDGRWTRVAVEALLELARGSAAPCAPAEVAAALEELVARCARIYPLEPEERRQLGAQLEALGRLSRPLPVVFQHGDAGVWNMLATAEGRVALLDWEAADPRGLPLWDLFYLLRSCAMSSRRRGRDRLVHLERRFLSDSPLGELLVLAARRSCEELELDPAAIEPLFLGCWVQRALKEATRLAPGALARGHYFGLLRTALARRHTPFLRRLFAAGS